WRKKLVAARPANRRCITVCGGTGCRALSSDGVGEALDSELKKQNLDGQMELRITGCPGFCEQGPIVVLLPERVLYVKVAPRDAADIIKGIASGVPVERLLFKDPRTGEHIVHEYDVPFYREQERILLKNNGTVDPTKIEDYVATGGYGALAAVLLDRTPESVIDEIKRSGLRGRGGAGFATGVKWELCRQAQGDEKYVICNADEGDPGAFQDRGLIEGNPHAILEGMAIGAFAVGASQGYVYIRHEYPLAVEMIRSAVKQAREYGFLGQNILGSDFNFDIQIQLGAGAFVCGEETALMASIEGRVGEPHPRPPFPAQKGLWGKPTNINNTKSWATVPHIITNGAAWYAKLGGEKSKGTTIFSLVGKINNTGLVEVPLGITLRRMIYDIGGGVPGGKKFKAVQTGGPSGGCIPESMLDLPLDYENLTAAGSMMGSGGMIVMDEETCMVDVARYFLDFTKFESCGKCVACREGIRQMQAILARITAGEGEEGDIELLQEMGAAIQDGALCGLGKTAPNPVLSTIRYFREEYQAHIQDKKCPAGVCKDLITFYVIAENCNGCTLCARNCTEQAITGELHQLHVLDESKCIRCGICREVCNRDAIGVR
ncbi:MAG TPA: NADH-quinone oxidoreductase subunit NuoF, partial [Anaerolineae bacterium]